MKKKENKLRLSSVKVSSSQFKPENYLCYSPNVVRLIYNVVQPYAVLCSPYASDSENKVNSTQLELWLGELGNKQKFLHTQICGY